MVRNKGTGSGTGGGFGRRFAGARRRKAGAGRFRPLLVPLEPRVLLAHFVVKSTADDPTNKDSLRYAVVTANANKDATNLITFDLGNQAQTIKLDPKLA